MHGDFRHGNLIIGPDGVRAVLDWELAHLGDPMEDLGWICVNSWRFGEIDKPVGGFGSREELFAGYEEAGRKVDPARVMFWEVMGTLRWGMMCCGMMQRFRIGPDHSMERAMIGRRSSETEIDLLRLLAPTREAEMQDEPTPDRTDQGGRGFPAQRDRACHQGPQRLQAARRHQRARSGDAATGAGAGGDAAEAARLKQLLGMDGSLIELNRALADRIANGEVDLQTPGLAEHLWQTTMDKLAVDQPNYASYKRELGE